MTTKNAKVIIHFTKIIRQKHYTLTFKKKIQEEFEIIQIRY